MLVILFVTFYGVFSNTTSIFHVPVNVPKTKQTQATVSMLKASEGVAVCINSKSRTEPNIRSDAVIRESIFIFNSFSILSYLPSLI